MWNSFHSVEVDKGSLESRQYKTRLLDGHLYEHWNPPENCQSLDGGIKNSDSFVKILPYYSGEFENEVVRRCKYEVNKPKSYGQTISEN